MSNDLISRKWLTDAIRNRRTYLSYEDAKDVIDLIDNAPTVKPEKVLIANVTFDEDKLKNIVQTEVIEKIKSGELVIKDERPQGEWVVDAGGYQCNKCFAHALEINGIEIRSNFCPNCGADMRKGGAECMDEDAKQASIPYTYNAPQHDWKCGYPDITRDKGGAE